MDERTMVRCPIEWPRWPVLPMKRRNGQFHEPRFCGFLLAQELNGADWRTRLYFGNLFALAGKRVSELTDYHDYPSVDALLAEYQID